MKVRELLQRKGHDVVSVTPTSSVSQIVQLLMRHNIGSVPVLSAEGTLQGIVSERHLVRAMQLHSGRVQDLTAELVMERDLPTCEANTSLHEMMSRMTRERLRHVLVLESGRLAGILSVGDLVKHRLEELETEASILRDYVTAARAGS